MNLKKAFKNRDQFLLIRKYPIGSDIFEDGDKETFSHLHVSAR